MLPVTIHNIQDLPGIPLYDAPKQARRELCPDACRQDRGFGMNVLNLPRDAFSNRETEPHVPVYRRALPCGLLFWIPTRDCAHRAPFYACNPFLKGNLRPRTNGSVGGPNFKAYVLRVRRQPPTFKRGKMLPDFFGVCPDFDGLCKFKHRYLGLRITRIYIFGSREQSCAGSPAAKDRSPRRAVRQDL